MSKARRNRDIRRRANLLDPSGKQVRSIARALRRHGRMPLEKKRGQL